MKQRLIGTVVLVCLALIFIPMLLDGEGIRPPAMNLDFPPAPDIETPAFTEPVRPTLREDTIVEAPAEPQLDLPPFVADEVPEAIAADQETQADAIAAATATEPPAAEPTPAPAEAAPSPEQVPAIDAAGLPEGWVVRLGLFGERANADRLLKELLAADYKAYLEPVTTAQGRMNGVFVGPLATRAEASALQNELKTRFKLDGMLSRFSLDTRP